MIANNDCNTQDTVSPTTRRAVKNAKRHGLQSPTVSTVDVINPVTAEVTQVALDDVATFTQLPTHDEWLARYYNDNTRLNDITLTTSHKTTTCAVCGGTIARGHDAIVGTDGDMIHVREYVCQRNIAQTSPKATAPTNPNGAQTNGTVHSEIEDAMAEQRAKEARRRMKADIHESVNKLDTWSNVHSQPLVDNPKPLPEYPRNYDEYRARYYAPTTDEFMAVLDSIEAATATDLWHVYISFPTNDHLRMETTDLWHGIHAAQAFIKQFPFEHKPIGYKIRPAYVYDQPQPAPITEPDDEPKVAQKTIIAIGEWVAPAYGMTMRMTASGRKEYNDWARANKVSALERRNVVWFVQHWDGTLAQVVNAAKTERILAPLNAEQIKRWFTPHKLSCGYTPDPEKVQSMQKIMAVYRHNWKQYTVNELLSKQLKAEFDSLMASHAKHALGDNQCRCIGKCRCSKKQAA